MGWFIDISFVAGSMDCWIFTGIFYFSLAPTWFSVSVFYLGFYINGMRLLGIQRIYWCIQAFSILACVFFFIVYGINSFTRSICRLENKKGNLLCRNSGLTRRVTGFAGVSHENHKPPVLSFTIGKTIRLLDNINQLEDCPF